MGALPLILTNVITLFSLLPFACIRRYFFPIVVSLMGDRCFIRKDQILNQQRSCLRT